MNSEIRASSALASKVAQSGPADLSIQNPLFSTGEADAFSQMLKQQVSVRDDSRRAIQAEQAAKYSRQQEDRQDKRAESRQDSGKSLPERSDRAAESRPEHPVARKSPEQKRDDKTDDASSVAANAQPNAPAAEQVTPVKSMEEGNAAPKEEMQATSGAQMAGDASAEDASVLAEIAALQAAAEGGDDPDLATMTDPSIAGNVELAELSDGSEDEMAAATEIVALDSQAPEAEADGASLDDVLLEAASDLPDSQNASSTTQPQVSVMSAAASPRSEMASTLNPDETATATSTATPSPAPMLKPADTASTSINDATAQKEEPGADGELAHWELGHEPNAAEKNAEKNTEFTQKMAAAAERNGPMKEQLAALAQQFKGGADSSTTKTETRKTEAGTDIKAPTFGRALEQLSSARVDSGKPVSTGVQTLVGQREWAGELGQRLMMMVSSKLKSAEIHLNPKDLGPVEVRIRMHEDKAHVVFTSQVPQTREALEQAMPRLREMFDQNGVALGNVDVQDQGARHSHQQEQASEGRGSSDGQGGNAADSDAVVEKATTRAVGLVDYYA